MAIWRKKFGQRANLPSLDQSPPEFDVIYGFHTNLTEMLAKFTEEVHTVFHVWMRWEKPTTQDYPGQLIPEFYRQQVPNSAPVTLFVFTPDYVNWCKAFNFILLWEKKEVAA